VTEFTPYAAIVVIIVCSLPGAGGALASLHRSECCPSGRVHSEAVSSDETQTNDPLTLHGPTTKTMPPINTLGLSGEIVAGDMLKTLEEKQRLADPVRVDAASRC
jgi:hypothetical protein